MVLETHAALEGEGIIAVAEVVRLARCDPSVLLMELSQLRPPPALFVHVGELSARHVLEPDKLERDGDGDTYISESIEELGFRCTLAGMKRLRVPGAILGALIANGSTRVAELFGDPGVIILDDWMSVTPDSCCVEKTAIRAIFPRVYRGEPSRSHSSLGGPLAPPAGHGRTEGEGAATGYLARPLPSLSTGVTRPTRVSELAELIRQEDKGRVDARTTQDRLTWIKQFVELMGDMWAHDIDKDVAYAYAESLKEMPANIGHVRRRLASQPGMSEHLVSREDLVREVRAHRAEGKTTSSVKRAISNFSQIWNSAESWGCMRPGAVNPLYLEPWGG